MSDKTHVPSRVLSAKFGYKYLEIDKSVFKKSDQDKKRLKLLKERQNKKDHKWSVAVTFNCKDEPTISRSE